MARRTPPSRFEGGSGDAAIVSAHSCPHCGKDLNSAPIDDTAPPAYAHSATATAALHQPRDFAPDDFNTGDAAAYSTVEGASTEPLGVGPLAIAMALLVAVAGLSWFVFAGSGDDPDTLEDTSAADTAPELADVGDSTDSAFQVTTAADLTAWFDTTFAGTDAKNYSFVYPASNDASERTMRVLRSDSFDTHEAKLVVGFEDGRGFPLFTSGTKTWGVNPDDPTDIFEVSRRFELVDMGLGGAVAFISYEEDNTSIGVSSFGGWGGDVDLPEDTNLLPVQGLGILVLPDTGGTMILRGTGLEVFSDDRVVAGSASTLITKRCGGTQLDCGLFFQTAVDDDGSEIPVSPQGEVALSTGGRWVLASDGSAPATLFDTETLTTWEPGVSAEPGKVAWSPDDQIAAWITRGELSVAFLEERRLERIALPDETASLPLMITARS